MANVGDEFDGAFKQAAAPPRRRRPQNLEEEAGNVVSPPVKAALKGGWSNANAPQGGSPVGGDEPSAARRRSDGAVGRPAASDDDDDGIPTIPDLEEVGEEVSAGPAPTVANAPSARANSRVQTLAELDAAIARSSLPSVPVETGIDLSLLQRVLHPYDEVAEPDEEWHFDTLVTQIAHELSVDEAAAAARAERLAELEKAAAQKPLGAATVRVGTRAPVNKGPDTRLSDE